MIIGDTEVRSLNYKRAYAALIKHGHSSPEFMAYATMWAYGLSEFDCPVAAEVAIQQNAEMEGSRGGGLAAMLLG